MRRALIGAAGALGIFLGGFALQPESVPRIMPPPFSGPVVAVDRDRGEGSIELRVLTYNIEGLPFPARLGRGRAVDAIAEKIAALRGTGREPDVIFIQEGFVDETADIGAVAGYGGVAHGPERSQRAAPSADRARAFPGGAMWWKGEGVGKLLGSGLWIFSRYPVAAAAAMPFGDPACAGYDCLANKGGLLARIAIAGVPQAIDLVTTHLNSRRSAGVSFARSHAAHHRQVDRLRGFLDTETDASRPAIIGGDFNIKNLPERFIYMARSLSDFNLVRVFCMQQPGACDDRIGLQGNAPWMLTQDIQGFRGGGIVKLRPVRIELLFDRPSGGAPLSDHVGYLVTYRLSWPLETLARR